MSEKILNELYRKELKKAIPPVLEKCSKRVGKTPSEVKVRNMKNCSPIHRESSRKYRA